MPRRAAEDGHGECSGEDGSFNLSLKGREERQRGVGGAPERSGTVVLAFKTVLVDVKWAKSCGRQSWRGGERRDDVDEAAQHAHLAAAPLLALPQRLQHQVCAHTSCK